MKTTNPFAQESSRDRTEFRSLPPSARPWFASCKNFLVLIGLIALISPLSAQVTIPWTDVSKTGSSLADLTTRSATDLTSGTLPDARFPATLPALSGANLTALNATQLTSGTVPVARLYTTAAGYNITNGAAIDALAAVASNGLLTRTAANTYVARTLTGTAGNVTVTNGDGVSGNPTLSLPTALTSINSITAASATDLTLAGGTAGTSAVKVSNTTAATSATTGAFQVGTNVGFSGNSGGPSYFGGITYASGGFAATSNTGLGATGTPSHFIYNSATTTHYTGDGTGFTWRVAKRSGSTDTSLFSLNDSTNAAILAGTLTASSTGTHTFGTTNTVTMAAGVLTQTTTATAAHSIISSTASNYSQATLKNTGASGREWAIGLGGSTAGAGGAGAVLANTFYLYDVTADRRRFAIDTSGNVSIDAGNLVVGGTGASTLGAAGSVFTYNGAVASTSTSTGTVVISGSGGLGVGGAGYFGGDLTVSGGNVGVGVAASADSAVYSDSSALVGASQFGFIFTGAFSSSALTTGTAIYARTKTAASAFTMVNGRGINVDVPVLGAGSAITTQTGLSVSNQGAAGITNAYGIDIAAQSGAATANVGLRNAGLTVLTDTTEATTGGAGSLTTAGGIYAAKAIVTSTHVEGVEQASSPAAPAANGFKIYAKDNGSGKTVLYVRFASGAEQQLAIEP